MNISGIEKLTLTDYPGHVAAVIFTQGCNFKCPFCHNSDLIPFTSQNSYIDEEEVLDYLEKRKGILDGLVISGGEPLLQSGIKDFITKVKDKGYKVKLDTNGTNAVLLKELLEANLLDYVAMDIKSNINDYEKLSGCAKYDFKAIDIARDILIKSGIDHEFRTTIVKEYHTYKTLENICSLLGDNDKYYLQNFVDSERVLEKGLHGFLEEELKEIINNLNKKFPNVSVRGL